MPQAICDLLPEDFCAKLDEVLAGCPVLRQLIEAGTRAGFDFASRKQQLEFHQKAAESLKRDLFPHVN